MPTIPWTAGKAIPVHQVAFVAGAAAAPQVLSASRCQAPACDGDRTCPAVFGTMRGAFQSSENAVDPFLRNLWVEVIVGCSYCRLQ